MNKTIIVAAEEAIGCPKCGHGLPLTEGISRQTIERHADGHKRALAAERKRLEAELAAEASKVGDLQRIGQGAVGGRQLDAIAVLLAVDAEVWAA
jgi:hypothetical protein